MKQSSYEDIQATGDLPRACHLDVGVTSHLEGTMQAPALDGKHSLKRVQAAVQGRLAVHGLELGTQLAIINAKALLHFQREEGIADRKATYWELSEVTKDARACIQKRDSLTAQVDAEVDAEKLETLAQELAEATEKTKAALERLVATNNHCIDWSNRDLPDPEIGNAERAIMRVHIQHAASALSDPRALASLAFGEGAGPERFTVVASGRRPGLVRRLIMRIRQR